MMDIDEITHHLGIELLGIIFDDDAVITTSNKGEPIVMDTDNPASQGYRNVARRLEGETVPLMKLEDQEEPGFWHRVSNWFHRG
jgi:Septum formation inhibitor-activating ATPase